LINSGEESLPVAAVFGGRTARELFEGFRKMERIFEAAEGGYRLKFLVGTQ